MKFSGEMFFFDRRSNEYLLSKKIESKRKKIFVSADFRLFEVEEKTSNDDATRMKKKSFRIVQEI